MADNSTLPATGDIIGADDVGGVKYQRTKLVWGPDGTVNDADVATGKPLPVQIRSSTGLIPVGEPTDTASTATDTTSASLIAILKQLSLYAKSRAGYSAAVTLTRTADSNGYTANDVVGAATGSSAALTFAIAGGAGESQITSASLEVDASALIASETSYRLYLYNVTPPSALGDNTAWDLPAGDRASFLGYIDLGTPVDLGSTLYVQTDNINKQIKTASANVFGYLVTAGGYTPTSGRLFVITLHAVAN